MKADSRHETRVLDYCYSLPQNLHEVDPLEVPYVL